MPEARHLVELALHREPTATDLQSGRNARAELMVNHPEMVRQDHLLLTVTALSVLGLKIGGLIGMFAVLFLLVVAVGTWVCLKVSRRPPTAHLS